MSLLLWYFVRQFIEFLYLSWGVTNKPYQTYRRLSLYKYTNQTLIVSALVIFYLFLVSIIRVSGGLTILGLIFEFTKAMLAFVVTFSFCALTIYKVGQAFGSNSSIATIVKLWSFTLLPTLGWFVMSTLSFVLLPPPRTTSVLGQGFSAIFISLSIGFLIWKIILYYLTLRFGLKFSMSKIIYSSMIIWPLWTGYWLVLYLRGIFKVPFI